ncbi:MAG: hypothetical protein LCH66_14470 [Actinobacteria bacterium]|nr:hypothetical protein [Actinomycetota bacterium]
MSDQNQPTPALGEQPDPQTPEWAQVTDPADADLAGEATEAIPTDHTAVQPEPVDPFAADPMAAVSVDGAADEPAVDQGSSVVPPVPAQPVAAAAAPASPGRSGWSLKKGLLVGAAALGIATLGAAGGAAAVSLAHADGGIGTSQQGGMFDGDGDGDGDGGFGPGRGHHGDMDGQLPPGGGQFGPNGVTGQMDPNGGTGRTAPNGGSTQQQTPTLPGTPG